VLLKKSIMKKYLLLAVISLFSVSIYAQRDDIVVQGSSKIALSATPKQIIDSLKKKFPNAKAVQAYQTSQEAAAKGWKMSKDDNFDTATHELTNYTLSFTRSDFKYYALFDAHGNLLREKFQQNDAKVPEAAKENVKKYIGINYKGYKVVSKTYFKTINYHDKKNYYEVIIVSVGNSNIKKEVILDDAGNVLSVRDI
jgi:hypothetical protein